jgi:hypothetical protein
LDLCCRFALFIGAWKISTNSIAIPGCQDAMAGPTPVSALAMLQQWLLQVSL